MAEKSSERIKYLIDIMKSLAHLKGDATWEGFLLYKIKEVYSAFKKDYLSKYQYDGYYLVEDEILFQAFALARNRILENKQKYLTKNEMQLNDSKVEKLIIEIFLLPSLVLSGVNKRVDVQIKNRPKYVIAIENELKSNTNEMRVAIEKLKEIKKTRHKRTKIETVKLSVREKVYPKMREELTRFADQCRFKNGKVNYSKLGSRFGVDNKTAKSWCSKYGITHQLPS
jgi:hypothetical protein